MAGNWEQYYSNNLKLISISQLFQFGKEKYTNRKYQEYKELLDSRLSNWGRCRGYSVDCSAAWNIVDSIVCILLVSMKKISILWSIRDYKIARWSRISPASATGALPLTL